MLASHFNGCRSEDFPSASLNPCLPHVRLIHYWAHCRLAIRSRHHRAKRLKIGSLYMNHEPGIIMVPGEIEEKSKFLKIFFRPSLGHYEAKSGQSRSVKVT